MALLRAKTEGGIVEGLPAGNQAVSVFKGVPFAAPPVGELRWKEPQPVTPWAGVRKCYAFSDIPMQRRISAEGTTAFMAKEFYPVKLPRSEDCLYLNIWTPAEHENEKLPVCMWIFGGGNFQGYGHKLEFDGEAYAKRGVIYVSINYRVNVFGFLTHPELSAESPNQVSGNYGMLDQVAAIKWIKRNIAAFGGDPNRLTIFGQSAGAGNVQNLLASHLSGNDISGAIMQSGGGLNGVRKLPYLQSQEKVGIEFFEFAGIKDIKQARAMDADAIFELHEQFKNAIRAFGSAFSAVVDGHFLTAQPREIFLSGNYKDIPVMIGCTADESIPEYERKGSISSLSIILKPVLGDNFEKFMEAANIKTDDDAANYNADQFKLSMLASDIAWCELKNQQNRLPSYMYYFSHVPPGEPSIGAFHSCEHMYLNQTLYRGWRPYKGEDFELSNTMNAYWCNFMKTGDPNGDGLAEWTPYTQKSPKAMEIKPGGSMIDTPISPVVNFFVELALSRN